ncbi:MAG: diaminopimelate decarboxylase [Deltaproteobacteria bacterium]|uniref:Diaminopimelate decarboxylase n=1 Tax=Candidatus Zymogenus saltonus TaxID=2844893 RepID=A0A9D8PNQ3_9DELT|nr:diaminopimelate decarboxylase [Candidatus Zymogenus saltonus]
MNYFNYVNDVLHAEDIPITRLAEKFGTPLYIYSAKTLRHHFRVFDNAFSGIEHLICFAMKANSNLGVLRLFAKMGAGFDIVSGGELFRALKAGGDPKKIVYSGVGKTTDEIREALKADILMFNVESFEELGVINEIAGTIRKRARISLRVNPDVDPMTHPKISTGLKENKFGIDIKKVIDDYEEAGRLPNIEVIGVDCHIGSQITEIAPFVDALERLKELVFKLRERGFNIRWFDIGGGLGITYQNESPPDPSQYAAAIKKSAEDLNVAFILEPGRVIVGNAGIMVTRVLYTKRNGKNFVVVDAGMNDLMRPAMYDSFHEIKPVIKSNNSKITADVVGPICESADFIAKNREIADAKRGDLLAVMSAGAYSFSMASNYNSRPRAAELLIDGKVPHLVRKRESYKDLILRED